jgi:hypothetical protein
MATKKTTPKTPAKAPAKAVKTVKQSTEPKSARNC